MPRQSPEARSAAAYLTGKPPAPPAILSPKARRLWREIVASRPPDYFRPGAQTLLAQFCEMAATQEVNLQMMAREPSREWQRAVQNMAMALNSAATKLRLAVSSAARAEAGILTEREPQAPKGKPGDLLFGGNVLRF